MDDGFESYDESSLWLVLIGIIFVIGLIGYALFWMLTNFDKYAR